MAAQKDMRQIQVDVSSRMSPSDHLWKVPGGMEAGLPSAMHAAFERTRVQSSRAYYQIAKIDITNTLKLSFSFFSASLFSEFPF